MTTPSTIQTIGPLPEFVTFTGVDQWTNPMDLLKLAGTYPVEFGILFSPKLQGNNPRFPHRDVIRELVNTIPARFSAHLCGADARLWIQDGQCNHDLRYFQRVQVNTTDRPNPLEVGMTGIGYNVRTILQVRGDFPKSLSVDLLFDPSGGRGVAQDNWPEAVNTTFCGYAGGLNPGNIAEKLQIIRTKASRYWIDMESGVRDENDRFSIEKCYAVCEAVYRHHNRSSLISAGRD